MTVNVKMKVGDLFLFFATFVWVTVAVGPWWFGVVLFLLAWIINFATRKT